MIFVKIDEGKILLLFWAYMGLHLHVYGEPVWYFEGEKHLGKVCVLRRGVHSCYVVGTKSFRPDKKPRQMENAVRDM